MQNQDNSIPKFGILVGAEVVEELILNNLMLDLDLSIFCNTIYRRFSFIILLQLQITSGIKLLALNDNEI